MCSISPMPRRSALGPRSRKRAGSQVSQRCGGSTMWSSTLMIFGSGVVLPSRGVVSSITSVMVAPVWQRRGRGGQRLQLGPHGRLVAGPDPQHDLGDPEPGVVLQLALRRRWCRRGRRRGRPGRAPLASASACRRGMAAARPLPPMGIQPSALSTTAREHRVVGAAADEGADARLLHGLGPGPRRPEVDELAVVLGLVAATRWPRRPPGARARRACRRAKSTPWSSASVRFQPNPTPRVTRPPERWSSVATCLASRIGSCWAASRMPVPSPMRVVTAAAVESATSGSRQRL